MPSGVCDNYSFYLLYTFLKLVILWLIIYCFHLLWYGGCTKENNFFYFFANHPLWFETKQDLVNFSFVYFSSFLSCTLNIKCQKHAISETNKKEKRSVCFKAIHLCDYCILLIVW